MAQLPPAGFSSSIRGRPWRELATSDPLGLRDRAILELFYATGVRRTEMTRLDHGDYDPAARTLHIRHGKGGKSRLLPVGERAAAWLDRFLTESRPLFAHLPSETAMFLTGYGTRITPAYLGTRVAGQMKLAGVTIPGSCHLFRHSCATAMHTGGADIRFVQEWSGATWTGAIRDVPRRGATGGEHQMLGMHAWKPRRSTPTSTLPPSPKSTPAATPTGASLPPRPNRQSSTPSKNRLPRRLQFQSPHQRPHPNRYRHRHRHRHRHRWTGPYLSQPEPHSLNFPLPLRSLAGYPHFHRCP